MADAGDARRLLGEHGDVFRAQLVAARWIDGWIERMHNETIRNAFGARRDPLVQKGFEEALRDIATHLRNGDFLPGGTLYEEEQRRQGAV